MPKCFKTGRNKVLTFIYQYSYKIILNTPSIFFLNKKKVLASRKITKPDIVAHIFNPSIREAETGRSPSSRRAWSTELVPE